MWTRARVCNPMGWTSWCFSRPFCLVTLGVLSMLLTPIAGRAQDRGRGAIICSSMDGQRTFCDADTRDGVRFVRQLGDVRCEEGSTWGFTERGIWVDRGCRAEFEVSSPELRRRLEEPERPARIEAGSVVRVRTDDEIRTDRSDDRVYTGVVDEDVQDASGRLALPRGTRVELVVRAAEGRELILDLESVIIEGQRYMVRAEENVKASDGLGANRRTGEYVGGGALLGSIIGAVAGGGKGALIGGVAGAAAGAGGEVLTRGQSVRVPRDSVLTFRLERPLELRIGRPYRGFRN